MGRSTARPPRRQARDAQPRFADHDRQDDGRRQADRRPATRCRRRGRHHLHARRSAIWLAAAWRERPRGYRQGLWGGHDRGRLRFERGRERPRILTCGRAFLAPEADNGPLDTVNRSTGVATEVATMNGTLGFRIAAFAFDGGERSSEHARRVRLSSRICSLLTPLATRAHPVAQNAATRYGDLGDRCASRKRSVRSRATRALSGS